MSGMTRNCTKCGVQAASDASFCESCGAAIAGSVPVPMSKRSAGRGTRHDHSLEKKMGSASTALMWVAIIQTIGAIFFYTQLREALEIPELAGEAKLILAVVGVLALAFWGLWWWSRRNPFVAGIVGLVLYVTLHVASAIVEPESLLRGLFIKLIIVAMLIKAVMAGAEYRRHMDSQES